MNSFLQLGKYSLGVGDRFARQSRPQLRACVLADQAGVEIIPVWNKSYREHSIIGSTPGSARQAADAAVHALGWKKPYHVDADHIRLETVDNFLPVSDFFTIDVADFIGRRASAEAVRSFVDRHPELVGRLEIQNVGESISNTAADIEKIISKYAVALSEAGRIYRHIASAKDPRSFITEVSMDETDSPQKPVELLVILAGLADEGIPLQTIAPKFTGRFNKGVDYEGIVPQFEKEFQDDLAVLDFAIATYGLPSTLKLSVHSGSDKFSIYEPIRRSLQRFDAGLHIKTAGTTWLEEVIGLAEAGGSGLKLASQIYSDAYEHAAELCAPYASVIQIDSSRLPSVAEVKGWTSDQFVSALRHDQANPRYNLHFRQLLHVGYKMAAKLGPAYLDALAEHEPYVSRNVTTNLYERHIRPLFLNGNGQPARYSEKEALNEVY